MFRRLLASWLVVLVLSPFTAPFSTCEIRVLLGGKVQSGTDQLTGRITPQGLTESLSAPAPVFARPAGRIRFAAFQTPDAAFYRILPRITGTIADGATAPPLRASALATILRI
jgi:hypothetical protein